MSELKVAVVILNYNGLSFLEKFLPTVLEFSARAKVYVAENGSDDDSVPFLEKNFPAVTVLPNRGNFGYAAGYNLALKKIEADYFILLNSDVEVTHNWIDPVIARMESDERIAACQPKLLDYQARNRFEYAGASGGFIDRFGYPFCRGRLFNAVEDDQHQFDEARDVFWASGACLFVKSQAFWRAGGFDGDYFAHMEEIDLCWRLKNLGYKIYVEPASVIYHVGGGTLHKLSARKTFLNFRNNITTLTKNHPPKNLLPKIFIRLVLDGVAAFKFLFDGQPKHFYAVFRAHMAYYRWLPRIMKQRKELQGMKGFKYDFSCIYRGNIVSEHFIQKKRKFKELGSGFFAK